MGLQQQMRAQMCPAFLEYLVHCHAHCGPHPNEEAPVMVRARNFFLRNEIIRRSDTAVGPFCTTAKGRAWLDAILSVPFPVQRWEVPKCID